jgi:hypothetical protein
MILIFPLSWLSKLGTRAFFQTHQLNRHITHRSIALYRGQSDPLRLRTSDDERNWASCR